MEEKRPMVSVVVLTYNHEKYIKQALDSILMQKVNFDYEILIGDDASSDNTVKILKEYQNKYPYVIKLFLNKENLGATRNAYNVLMNAKGKYLATCEGDDYWIDVNKLQIQVDFLEFNKDYIGCTHRTLIVDESGKKAFFQKLNYVKEKRIFTKYDFDGLYLPGHVTAFVRHNIFYKCQNDYSIIFKIHKMIADRTLMLIYLSYGNIHFINKTMSAYRRFSKKNNTNITNISYTFNKNKVADDYYFTCCLEKFAREGLHLAIDFEKRKKIIFASSLIQFIISPSLNNLKTVKYILENGNDYLDYLLFLPKGIIIKIKDKYFY